MLYQCLNCKCKHVFEGEDSTNNYQPCLYCPVCGWLVAPEGAVEPEAVLKNYSRCYYAYFCRISGEFYHKDCEVGPSERCHNIIEYLLPEKHSEEVKARRRHHQAIQEVLQQRMVKK